MKALSFEIDGRRTYGLQQADRVFEAAAAFRERHADLRAVLAAGALGELPRNLAAAAVDAGAMRYLPVIPKPDKIICVGVNYRPHVEEMGREIPSHPVLFVRFPGSLVGHLAAVIRPRASEQFDFEGELAVVIGRPARHVAAADAFDVVAGYTCFMDGSVRDWQRHTMQFTPGKNFDSSGAMGPWLVTPDEIADIESVALTTTVNGEVMQQGRVSELIFGIPALIAYCSTFTELLPGDVIATGTPGGVGAARKPPVWLTAGDRVVVD
ncbi:MAG: fumarylacetoacetate hydrolase family protein, partial [Woeseiaceae bacterium]|nr:fumarylacetoacetate hydrolase family protein [Woeseiaceae bacterium]